MADRDIECVLIAGAGASRNLASGSDRFPLMGDWSSSLCKHLSSLNQSYLEVTGLKVGLDGPHFEEALGTFLRQAQSFAMIRSLVPRTLHLPGVPTQLLENSLPEWHSQSAHGIEQSLFAIQQSLYTEFGRRHIDQPKASSAYGSLLDVLGITLRSSHWVFATTNYDKVAEVGLRGLGLQVDDGVRPGPYDSSEGEFDIDGLVSQSSIRRVPLLHLHGRIGWYRRPSGEAYSINADTHDQSFGIPIVMLPDLEKTYSDEPIVDQMWAQFVEALQRARRVFVLGHSLHDEALVNVLSDYVSPHQRVAVAALADFSQPDSIATDAQEVVKVAEELGFHSIPLIFGDGEIAGITRSKLEPWMVNQ